MTRAKVVRSCSLSSTIDTVIAIGSMLTKITRVTIETRGPARGDSNRHLKFFTRDLVQIGADRCRLLQITADYCRLVRGAGGGDKGLGAGRAIDREVNGGAMQGKKRV